MTYATSSDIESEFKNIDFDTDSAVTSTEVTEFISQEEAVINQMVANRYEVPITGTESLKVMKSISINFVAWRVAKILNLKKDVPIPKELVPQALNEGQAYLKSKKLLEEIRKGGVILTDAVARSSTQGIKSYNASSSICPLWERDTKQW